MNLYTYNGSGEQADRIVQESCVSNDEWHLISFEVDIENKILRAFSDGIIRVECKFKDFNYNFTKVMGDLNNNRARFKVTEFAVFNSLRSSGEGENRTYPVPTEPLV